MRKKLLVVAIMLVSTGGSTLLAACGGDDGEAAPSSSEPVPVTARTNPHLNDHVERVTIDGMPCLIWKDKGGKGHSTYTYSGLTCDWNAR